MNEPDQKKVHDRDLAVRPSEWLQTLHPPWLRAVGVIAMVGIDKTAGNRIVGSLATVTEEGG